MADPLPGDEDQLELQSWGLGLRYQVRRNLSVRFDYGWQLKDLGFGEERDSRAHIGMMLSF